MAAHMPRFHESDDMKGRGTRLSSTISFLSMPLEHVFFILKPTNIFLSSSITQFHHHVRKRSTRDPNTQNPSIQEGFISAISVSSTRHSHPSKLIPRKSKLGRPPGLRTSFR